MIGARTIVKSVSLRRRLLLVVLLLALVVLVLVTALRVPGGGGARAAGCLPGVPANNTNSSGAQCISKSTFYFTTVPPPTTPNSSVVIFRNITFSFSWSGIPTPAGQALLVVGSQSGVSQNVTLSDGPPGPGVYAPVLAPNTAWGVQWGPPSAPGLRLLVQ
jgi:hypothetical protein